MKKGSILIHFCSLSGTAGHYSPKGSIRHSLHSKKEIGLFLFALYMYNHQTSGIKNSINIPNIKGNKHLMKPFVPATVFNPVSHHLKVLC